MRRGRHRRACPDLPRGPSAWQYSPKPHPEGRWGSGTQQCPAPLESFDPLRLRAHRRARTSEQERFLLQPAGVGEHARRSPSTAATMAAVVGRGRPIRRDRRPRANSDARIRPSRATRRGWARRATGAGQMRRARRPGSRRGAAASSVLPGRCDGRQRGTARLGSMPAGSAGPGRPPEPRTASRTAQADVDHDVADQDGALGETLAGEVARSATVGGRQTAGRRRGRSAPGCVPRASGG